MREDRVTEFKRKCTEDLKHAVVAFANTDGGTIYIGIEDDGRVCGVEDVDGAMLQATNMIRDSIMPDVTMFVNVEVHRMEEKDVIAVTVQRGTDRPYYLAKKGVRPEGVYVRHGASSVPASRTMILNMIKETCGDHYEDIRSLNQDLTFEKMKAYFEKHQVELGPAQMRTLGLVSHDGTYTNLAYLLSDQCSHTIKMAAFQGTTKMIFRNRKELTGSLFEQLDQANEFLDKYNQVRSEFPGLYRQDNWDYPVSAVREAMLNIIIHRDYSMSVSGFISVFDDRIEILNMGSWMRGVTCEEAKMGVSALRNPKLANVFYRLELIEAYGTGLIKIDECYANYNVTPKIETSENAFKITLPNTNHEKDVAFIAEQRTSYLINKKDSREGILLRLCREKGTIVRRDVEEALQVSQPMAVLILREMVNRNLLVKEGEGKNTRYRTRV